MYRNGELHWACEECIVRACCEKKECYLTKLFNPLCISCKFNKTCEEKCKSVVFSELMNNINKRYGKQLAEMISQHMKESSIINIYFKNLKENE